MVAERFSETSVKHSPLPPATKHPRPNARSTLTSNHRASLKSVKRKDAHAQLGWKKVCKVITLKTEKKMEYNIRTRSKSERSLHGVLMTLKKYRRPRNFGKVCSSEL